MEHYSVIEKNEIFPSAATWMDLELSEMSYTVKYYCYHLQVESKKQNKWMNILKN